MAQQFNIARIRYTWKNVWLKGATYIKDDIVRHGGNVYICMVGHVSDQTSFATDLNATPGKWLKNTEGFQWRGDWVVETRYVPNDLIKYNGVIYKVLQEHVSASTTALGISNDTDKLQPYAKTPNWRVEWAPATRYRIDDVVKYGGYVYQCLTEHTSATTVAGLENDQSKWDLVVKTDDWKIDWSITTKYKVNDFVRYGARLYRCNTGHTSAATTILGLEQDQAKWDVILDGICYKGEWQGNLDSSGIKYKVGDIVMYGPTLWRCKTAHQSLASFDEAKFDIWCPGLGYEAVWNNAATYQPGDIVVYGGYTYVAMKNNTGSPPSVTGVFYEGESLQGQYDWELMLTGYQMKGEWDSATSYKTGEIVRNGGFVYIAVRDSTNEQPDALTPESRGYYDPGSTRSTEGSINMYWQLLLTGIYYRGEWFSTQSYVLGDIIVYKGTSYKCVQAHQGDDSTLVTPDLDTTNSYWIKMVMGNPNNVLAYRGDLRTHDGSNHTRLGIGLPGQALKVVNGTGTWERLGEVAKVYYVAMNGKDDSGFGLTISAPFASIKYATQYILADEANRAPATIFVSTGLYSEITPINVPSGVAIVGDELRSTTVQPRAGYETNDMFRVRNGCGIRNMTLQGMVGQLGSADNYGAQIPNTGAYVALDPGAGPTDTSVWVTNKSTYVQNVTTLGSGCIGMKIDGTLHNGGNRSIVANDFTQVLSDGIGVWCNDDGKAELVSVFTYYCHIGYYCTGGGKIRATNGNNSYGKYGSFAEGEYALETPITATLNNRYYDAEAPVVYNDGNQILALGYTHAGQDYADATYTITGSGSGVDVDNDFIDVRNAGISEIRLLDPGDSSLPGGRGHTTAVRNSAQEGTNFSIKIANSDTGNAEQYVGRAILTINNISGADANRVQNALDHPITYTNVTGTSNNQFAGVTNMRFTVVVDNTGNCTVTVTHGGDSHRVGDTITIADASLGNYGGAPLTFNVATISESMQIFIEEGKGVGQFGIIDEYFPSTKLINVIKASDGKRGFDHILPGQAIETSLDGSTTYRIEPRIKVAEPNYASTAHNTNNTNVWKPVAGVHNETVFCFPGSGTDLALYSDNSQSAFSAATVDAGFVRPQCIVKCKGKLKYWIALGNGNRANLSTAATAWGSNPYPITQRNWVDIAEGPFSDTSHTVIAVADDSDELAVTTTDGTTWTYVTSGMGTGLKHIRYGNGKWIAVKADGTAFESTDNGQNWQSTTRVCPTTFNVTDFTYGNGRFIAAVKPNGTATFPFNPASPSTMISDGTSTTTATFGLPSTFYLSFTDYAEGANNATWRPVEASNIINENEWGLDYTDGVFMAVDSAGNVRQSDGGDTWVVKTQITPPVGAFTPKVHVGTGTKGPQFVVIDTGSTATINTIKTGRQAQMRATIDTGRITRFVMTDPGSGYDSASPPTVDVIDTQKTQDANISVRIKNNVLAQPAFKSRGSGYVRFNAVTITGNGFIDKYQTGGEVVVDDLTLLPSPGDNMRFAGITDVIYKVGSATVISGSAPNIRAKISIAPTMGIQESPEHGTSVTIRQKYSQVRLTFHDFLDIGTGNFNNTDYPKLYLEGFGSVNPPEQMWEANEYNGGRVFYASTDQDGNFRVGELFKVEQSTGIVSISASQFDLSGLNELRLGAFVLGGTNAVIREFSKEQTFVANSNAIVPTQRAIAAYIQSRISGGGANVAANALTAGTCKFDQINHLSNTGDLPINIPVPLSSSKIPGGTMVAQAYNNLGMEALTLIDSQDDYEGDGLYYNDAGNGYNSNG